MKYTIFLLAVLLISCDKEIDVIETIPYGNYVGKFNRSNMYGKFPQSNVTLTFSATGFSGESDMIKYPAICNGTYSVTESEIDFSNACIWTAEFDWSYILDGTFEYTIEGDVLELVKVSNGNTDRYTLTRQ